MCSEVLHFFECRIRWFGRFMGLRASGFSVNMVFLNTMSFLLIQPLIEIIIRILNPT